MYIPAARGTKLYVALLCLFAVVSGLIASTSPLAIFGITGLLGILVVAAIFIRRPVRALYAYIFLLPFHSLILTVLLAQAGVGIGPLKVVASWKEVLLVGTFIIVVFDTLLENRAVRLVWVDVVALVWLGQVVAYFLFHDLFFDWTSNLTIKAYGARDWLLYLLPYIIGRLVSISTVSATKILKSILFIGVVTSVIGIIEYFFVPVAWHVQLGVPRYFREFLNLAYPDYTLGLPYNYWAEFAGLRVRRAVSTYLSGQAFAVPFLVIWPVVLYNYVVGLTKGRRTILVVCGFALLLTITRMTIVVCFIQTLLMLRLLRKEKLVLGILAGIMIIVGTAFIAYPRFQAFVVNTITLRDTSSSARPQQWIAGIQAALDRPLGSGLGSSGQTGTRFGAEGEGQEAGYFRITGALGLPGLILFLSWFAGIIVIAFTVLRRSRSVWQGVAGVTLTAAFGFLLNTLTGPVDQSPFTIYVFAWLAGLTVRRVAFGEPSQRTAT